MDTMTANPDITVEVSREPGPDQVTVHASCSHSVTYTRWDGKWYAAEYHDEAEDPVTVQETIDFLDDLVRDRCESCGLTQRTDLKPHPTWTRSSASRGWDPSRPLVCGPCMEETT